MSIYNHTAGDRTPYFYIIIHKPSNMKYVGSRWAKGCHPNEFLTPDGYNTSCGIVKKLIMQDGYSAFMIIRLIEESSLGLCVYDYETRFLQENRIAERPDWINTHNNEKAPSFGSVPYKKLMVLKFGVDNPSKCELVKTKKEETCFTNYGVYYPSQSAIVQEKQKQTCISKYGVEYALQAAEVQNKIKTTNLEKYGTENVFQSDIVKTKIIQTNIEMRGVEYALQSEDVKNKSKMTWMTNYGVDNPAKSKDIQLKIKDTCDKKYGETHFLKTETGKTNQSKKRRGDIWFRNIKTGKYKTSKTETPDWLNADWVKSSPLQANTIKIQCPHCLDWFKKCHFSRFHGDNCKMAKKNSDVS